MEVYTYTVTIKRSDDSNFSYIRGWNGYSEEEARRKLLDELHQCELQIVSLTLRKLNK
jgi:hypothetical protein